MAVRNALPRSTYFYVAQKPTAWEHMLHVGGWFQRFPSLDCGIKRELIRMLQEAEFAGVTIAALDVRVAAADWLWDAPTGVEQRDVLAVVVYRMEDGSFTVVASQLMVHLEPRHFDNRLVREL